LARYYKRLGKAYRLRLADTFEEYGWNVLPNRSRWCSYLLRDPRHKCAYGKPTLCGLYGRTEAPRLPGWPGIGIDHSFRLYQGEPARPSRWATLTQPYHYEDRANTAWYIGPAPYGHGTYGLLLVGHHVEYVDEWRRFHQEVVR
jgi:hypothetical protein